MPPTFPVTGSVLYENGKPYQGGTVQFRSDSKDDLTILGGIKEDGSFQLRTLNGKKRAEGAPAGIYQVTIVPALGKDRKPLFVPFIVPSKFAIEPKENSLTIRANLPPQ